MLPEPEALAPLGACQKCKFLDPTPGLLSQKHWGLGGRAQRPVSASLPGDSGAPGV